MQVEKGRVIILLSCFYLREDKRSYDCLNFLEAALKNELSSDIIADVEMETG